MSDIMTRAVLKMPYELAMSNEMSRVQFHARAGEAADELDRLRAENARLNRVISARDIDDQHTFAEVARLREALQHVLQAEPNLYSGRDLLRLQALVRAALGGQEHD